MEAIDLMIANAVVSIILLIFLMAMFDMGSKARWKIGLILFIVGMCTSCICWRNAAWDAIEADGGYRENFSAICGITERQLKDGSTIQLIEYERDRQIHTDNMTDIFHRILPKGTKIRIFTSEKWRNWYNLSFQNYTTCNFYEIITPNRPAISLPTISLPTMKRSNYAL